MSLLIDLLVAAVIVYSAISGTKQGMVLIGLELISFLVATVLALAIYHPAGGAAKFLTNLDPSLANIAGFIVVWVLTVVACAVVMRFALLPHLTRQIQLSNPNRIGGAVLNTLKSAAIITLGLIIFASLPLSPDSKRPVLNAFVSRQFLAASGGLQTRLALGLGRDFAESLTFFTVTAEPESEQRIELGYTTTKTSVDSPDEGAMLVLLNHERTTRGLPALSLNTKARAVARTYSTAMFAGGFFSHVDLAGKTPFDRLKAAGLKYGSAGENLALAPTLQLAHDGLMKSPGHKANILSPSYRTVGIGIIDGGPYGLMITQDFTD